MSTVKFRNSKTKAWCKCSVSNSSTVLSICDVMAIVQPDLLDAQGDSCTCPALMPNMLKFALIMKL